MMVNSPMDPTNQDEMASFVNTINANLQTLNNQLIPLVGSNGSFTGDTSGNAGTVTNGMYTVGNQDIGGQKNFTDIITQTYATPHIQQIATGNLYSTMSWMRNNTDNIGSFYAGVNALNNDLGDYMTFANSIATTGGFSFLSALGIQANSSIAMVGATSNNLSLDMALSGYARGEYACLKSTSTLYFDASGHYCGYWDAGSGGSTFTCYSASALGSGAESSIRSRQEHGGVITKMNSSDSYGWIGTQSSHDLYFGTGDAWKMKIASGGTWTWNGMEVATGQYTMYFNTGTGQIGRASSSLRYKENIRDLPFVQETFDSIRPVLFNLKADESKADSMGLIAEELVSLYPESVMMLDGQPEAVAYDKMVALCIKAIQELTKRVKVLEGHVI